MPYLILYQFLHKKYVLDLVQEKLHVQHKKLRYDTVQEHAEDHITIKGLSLEPVHAHRRPEWLARIII